MHYANRDGSLTPEAIDLLNKAAVEAPHEMYPLSQLAADMGRAGLLTIIGGLAPNQRPWLLYVTNQGWDHVTDPEALTRHRREGILKRLGRSDEVGRKNA